MARKKTSAAQLAINADAWKDNFAERAPSSKGTTSRVNWASYDRAMKRADADYQALQDDIAEMEALWTQKKEARR